jgi:hypothetical protein
MFAIGLPLQVSDFNMVRMDELKVDEWLIDNPPGVLLLLVLVVTNRDCHVKGRSEDLLVAGTLLEIGCFVER